MIRKNPTHKPKNLKKWSHSATTCHNVKCGCAARRGESLDSAMPSRHNFIANKLEAEKKNNPIKELENEYIAEF